MRGRKPLPTAVKRARGTLRPHRVNADEPRIVPCEPPMPAHFAAPQRARWRAWCAELLDIGTLTHDCGASLEALVMSEMRVRRARREVAKFGAVEMTEKGARRSAWALELDAAEREFRSWCVEFGVTPSARSRVKAQGAKKAEAPKAPTARDIARERFFGGA